ncbi:molybdopterin molybdotransferase MoeA [Phenylobacterium sp. LH3H17]|uniref:molybdopterin molybdotransferase MoeA n=1 Tax=Phenylobacterium sp. LH3H17 TaxID=2903901 RepID=UPI0020C9D020|nr:molybdopterin molybdotransferase MoeA [Phenylobacterium sp. LH3H17]UTP38454.1 molybdopterin molybdotransferase MoeA [Phenylobacterium sp. LH3H17]
MIGFDEACRRIAAIASPLGAEQIALDLAWNRVLAAPVVACRSAPETAVSAMDGYAVRDADLASGPARLRLVGTSFAGSPNGGPRLEAGACVRIFTGAPMPAGADRVVMQEVVQREGEAVMFAERPSPARHVRAAGSDFAAGEALLELGTRLTPQALVAAAAADLATVEVFIRPRVAVLSTGDELVEPGLAPHAPGTIPESVSFGVAALARAWGGEVTCRRRLGDELPSLVRAAAAALDDAHVVVVTGGASVGERDFSKAMFQELGLRLDFDKVAIKPGKPVWVGRVGERIVVGLPGNPSAAMVTARLFLAPILAGLSGTRPEDALAWRAAPLASPLGACGDRDCFHRGRSTFDGVRPVGNQDSSAQKDLAMADLLIRRRPAARALAAGELVEVLAF